jgi:hypothetical protein
MTNNPFQLLGNKEKLTINYVIEDLDNQDLINYFETLIYRTFPKDDVKNDLQNSVNMIIESLTINLNLISTTGKTKCQCFEDYYKDLYNLLELY